MGMIKAQWQAIAAFIGKIGNAGHAKLGIQDLCLELMEVPHIPITNEFSAAMHVPGIRRRRCASSP